MHTEQQCMKNTWLLSLMLKTDCSTTTVICLYLHLSVWLVVVHDGLLKMSPCWLLPDFYFILPVAAIESGGVYDPEIAPYPLYSALLWVSAASTYLYSQYTLSVQPKYNLLNTIEVTRRGLTNWKRVWSSVMESFLCSQVG